MLFRSKALRELMLKKAVLSCKAAKEDTDSVYRLYYAFSQSVSKLQSHQILAINRGEKETFLKVELSVERQWALGLIWNYVLRGSSSVCGFVQSACEDAYDRLDVYKRQVLDCVILDSDVTVRDHVILKGTPEHPVIVKKGATI